MNNLEKEAVALEYGNNTTPIITAKGEAELAEIIIQEAKKQGIYIAEDPKLLSALAKLDIDQEIPRNFSQQLLLFYRGLIGEKWNREMKKRTI